LKEETLDHSLWRTRLERGSGPGARQVQGDEQMNFQFSMTGNLSAA